MHILEEEPIYVGRYILQQASVLVSNHWAQFIQQKNQTESNLPSHLVKTLLRSCCITLTYLNFPFSSNKHLRRQLHSFLYTLSAGGGRMQKGTDMPTQLEWFRSGPSNEWRQWKRSRQWMWVIAEGSRSISLEGTAFPALFEFSQ